MARWYVYILRCGDGTLYAGVTTDVSRRIAEHRRGIGAKYTRGRGPLRVIHRESFRSRIGAQRREAEVKSWTRARKLKFIQGA